MIPVRPAPEPTDFDTKVRQPSIRALHERIGAQPPVPRPAGQKQCAQAKTKAGNLIERFEDLGSHHFPSYWTECLDELFDAYDRICAYACFYIHPITGARSADHMIPKSDAWDHVYEWANYRLASGRLNARKKDYQDVIDPFEVGEDWFEMEFVAFLLKPGAELPGETKVRIKATIERLGLNDKSMREARESDYADYTEGHVSLAKLRRESPLVAREVIRAGRLRPEDQPRAPGPPTADPTPQDP